MRAEHLSGCGQTTYTRSTKKFLTRRAALPGGEKRSGIKKPITTGPSLSDAHWRMCAWSIAFRLGGEASTKSDLKPHTHIIGFWSNRLKKTTETQLQIHS